jgi:predicted nuclease of predicted toxin-antitoxin system
MRFLADVGVSISTAEMLRTLQHDVLHLSEQGLHRLPDDKILVLARHEDRVILIFDLDFGDLLAAGAHPLPSAILLRAGALVIVEENRYRLRRLPIQGFSSPEH